MVFETAVEREALASVWEDSALVGTTRIPGQYDEPQAEDLLVEGTAPTFLAARAHLEAIPVTAGPGGTTIDSVTTHDGRTRGPYRVVRYASLDDGAFVLLGLQAT